MLEICEESNHRRDRGQDKLLELLKKFDEKCREFDITYYLGGGTALGAVRHEGFLPWDDDVDLYITRNEYKKLCSVQESFFSDDFVLANNENYNRYRNPYARCIDTESTAVTLTRLADDAPKGQFLELFILDPIPTNEAERNSWLTLFWIYCELLCRTYRNASEKNVKWVDFDLYEKYLSRCEDIGWDAVLLELKNQLFCIEEDDADDYILSWGGEFYIYPISAFGKPRDTAFEDAMFPVANKAEIIFRIAYGDDWALIPQNENQIRHKVKSDMDHSYIEYLDNVSEFDNLWDFYPERKKASLELFRSEIKFVKTAQTAMADLIKKIIDKENCVQKVKKMIGDCKWNEALEYISPWLDAQFSDLFLRWRQYLDIGNEGLEAVLSILLHTGNFNKFKEIISLLENSRIDSTAELDYFKLVADAIRNANMYMDVGEFQLAKMELCRIEEDELIRTQEFYQLTDIRLCVAMYKEQDLERLAIRISDLQAKYPGQIDFLFYRGVVEYLLGNKESARYLEKFYNKSRNGMMRLAIEKMLKMKEGIS